MVNTLQSCIGVSLHESISKHLLISISSNTGSEIPEFLYDAKRFLLKNLHIIDTAPYQLYCSALVFSPRESIIRKVFDRERSRRIHILPQVENSWSAELQTLEGHSGAVQSVAFSPDGQKVASGSGDETIKLWNATTGQEQQTLKGHSGVVLSVVISPDGQTVASGSVDKTVKLWDATTGQGRQTLESHSNSWSVAPQVSFTNDWVAFGSENVLWIPYEYRPFSCSATQDGSLTLGYGNGRVFTVGFCTD